MCEKKVNSVRAIFLDADGVLWQDIGSGGILTGKSQSIENLKMLSSRVHKKYIKIIISNQTLAARKQINYLKFRYFVRRFFKRLIRSKLINGYAVCYHHPNSKNFYLRKNCRCRKPLPGLIHAMAQKYSITLSRSFLIGDRITDIQSGNAAGIINLYLIVNTRMFESNANLNIGVVYQRFIPVKSLEEFSLIKDLQNDY